jgi:hypothetical protein
VRILYAIDGKLVAEVADATQIPRDGDFVWLTLNGSDRALYRVLRAAWRNEVVKGTDAAQPRHSETDVIVMIEALTKT